MTVEVSQLQVKVSSDGIKEATDGLNSLVKAATAAESKSVILKSATEGVSKANGASAEAADKLIKKYKQAVDLLGANTEETFRYVAAAKGLSADQVALAGRLGSQVDAYKQLIAQQREAEAAARAEAKAQEALTKAHGDAIEMNKRKDAAAQAAAQREVNAELRAAAKAEEDLARAQGQAIEMNKRYDRKKQAQEWRELGVAQAEAIRMNKQMDSANAATAATTARVEKQQREFIATLKEQAETANMTASQLIAYRAAQMGVTDQAAPYIKRMQEMEKSNNLVGVSLKQQAFAFKMLPAQMSDIAVQLAGGQNPFLILLQQGSQIKDSFGGLTNTFKAFAAALTPVRLVIGGVAAAVSVLGYAYYTGSKRWEEFNEQLILTNGYAGLTKSQFTDLAASLTSIGVTKNAASKALTEVAGAGIFAADSIETVTKAALQMQDTTGQAVEKTVAQFKAIEKDPVKAVQTLNETYHFLTAAVLEQITTLEQQGDHQEAVKLATEEWAKVIDNITPKIISNMSIWAKAWREVSIEAKKYWDIISDIGDDKSLDQRIKELQDKMARASGSDVNRQSGGTRKLNSVMDYLFSGNDANKLAMLEMEKQMSLENQAIVNQQNQVKKAGTDAFTEISKQWEKIKGPEKLSKDLQKLKKDFEDLYAGNVTGISEEQRSNFLKGVSFDEYGKFKSADKNSRYQQMVDELNRKDVRKTPTNEYDIDAQLKQLQGTIDEEKRLLDRNNVANKNAYDVGIINLKEYLANDYDLRAEALREQKALVEEQIKVAQGKKNLAAVEKYKNDLSKIQDEIYKNGEEYNSKVAKADSDEQSRVKTYLEGLQNVVDVRRKEIANMLAGAGIGDVARGDMQRALKIQEDYQNQLQALNKKFPDARRKDSEYLTEYAGLQKQLQDNLKAEESYKDARVKLQQDWQSGASDAWQNYFDSTKDVAGQTKAIFANTFSGMTDALTNFVMTGKLSFGDFARSIIAQIIKMQIAAATSSIFSTILSVGSAVAGGTAASAAAGSIDMGGGTGLTAPSGALTPKFADGGAFTNGIVSTPTNFDIGQMGEAGPEAIVPLTKTADGSLGVTMKGVGSDNSGPIALSTHITINNDGSASTTTSSTGVQQEQAKALAQTMENVARQAIYKEMQQGGAIWKMKNGTR